MSNICTKLNLYILSQNWSKLFCSSSFFMNLSLIQTYTFLMDSHNVLLNLKFFQCPDFQHDCGDGNCIEEWRRCVSSCVMAIVIICFYILYVYLYLCLYFYLNIKGVIGDLIALMVVTSATVKVAGGTVSSIIIIIIFIFTAPTKLW